jgi:hypothetical protein
MERDAIAAEFRRRLDEMQIVLRPSEADEDRFVFELASGQIVIDPHPTQARQLLLLAEALYTKGFGEALELAGLVARREELEEDTSLPMIVVWQSADLTSARLNPEDWVRFEDWVADQFFLEDLIAKMDEGVPI